MQQTRFAKGFSAFAAVLLLVILAVLAPSAAWAEPLFAGSDSYTMPKDGGGAWTSALN